MLRRNFSRGHIICLVAIAVITSILTLLSFRITAEIYKVESIYPTGNFSFSDLPAKYQKYRQELLSMHTLADRYCKQSEVFCLSDTLEIEIAYMRIRETMPKIVWEVSPSHGYSTLWLVHAVARNSNIGRVISFDIEDRVSKFAPPAWSEEYGWSLEVGDFKANFMHLTEKLSLPDYLFLDSFHSADFGRFYVDSVFPLLLLKKQRVYVSLHDVYNPSFWTDGPNQNLRKTANLPDWMANEEGQVVLDWMAYHSDIICCVFTPSPYHDVDFTKRLVISRENVFGKNKSLDSSIAPLKTGEAILKEANPTLFFEISRFHGK